MTEEFKDPYVGPTTIICNRCKEWIIVSPKVGFDAIGKVSEYFLRYHVCLNETPVSEIKQKADPVE